MKVVFHQTFPDLKRILLLDADTIILKPVENLFDLFDTFSNETVIGMAQEHPQKENGNGFEKIILFLDFRKLKNPLKDIILIARTRITNLV